MDDSMIITAPVSTANPAPRPLLTPVDAGRPDETLSLDELGSRLVGLAGRLAAATCRWLLLLARFDALDGGAKLGFVSTARWLGHHCGIAHRTAVEHLRVARGLAEFPAIAEAMCSGRLSYSQARAITRLPHAGEDRLVGDLIELAAAGTVHQLETVVRGLRSIEDNEQPLPEYVRHGWTSTSHWKLSSRLAPERGALVDRAVEQVARAEGLTRPDALVRLAEIGLAALTDADDPPRTLRGDEAAAVIVHLDGYSAQLSPAAESAEPGRPQPVPATTSRGNAVPGALVHRPFAHVAGGPGLPAAVVERLLCAGRIRSVGHDGAGNVRDIGRAHRLVTKRQYRALLLRDGGCAHPGCGARHGLQAHHVRHWLHGGTTDLANLVLLCPRHHAAHHDGAFEIAADPGSADVRFRHPDGRQLERHPDPWMLVPGAPAPELVDADIGHPARPDGDRLDRDWAVSVFADRRVRAAAAAS